MREYIRKAKVVKKLKLARDKIIDVEVEGYGCDKTKRILEMINELIIKESA